MEKALAPLFVLNVLREYSDELHPLRQQDIIDKIEAQYDVQLERKAIARHLTNLETVGYYIERTKNGVYLVNDNGFKDSELRLLIDSVLFSRHISGDAAEDLIKKLKKLGSVSLKNKLVSVYSAKMLTRVINDCLYENIDIIGKAIGQDRRIAFYYCEYGIDKKLHKRTEEKRIIDPYQLITANNHYYLLGKDIVINAVLGFRIEKITKIEYLDVTRDKVKGRIGFDLNKYINENPYMYGGEICPVEMLIQKDSIGEIIDAFGFDFSLLSDDEDTVKIRFFASLSDVFDWIKRFGNIAEIISPQNLRNKIREYCNITYEKYCVSDDDRYSKELTDEYKHRAQDSLIFENIDLRDKNEYKEYKNVKELVLRNNKLCDVTFLSEFPDLTSLTIEDNPIIDLSCLCNLKNLQKLIIKNTSVTDFQFLAQLSELKELTVLDEKKYDLNAICNIWGLELLRTSAEIASGFNVLELRRSCPNLQISISGIQGDYITLFEMVRLIARLVNRDKIREIVSLFPMRRRDVRPVIERKEYVEQAMRYAKEKKKFSGYKMQRDISIGCGLRNSIIDWMVWSEYIKEIADDKYEILNDIL